MFPTNNISQAFGANPGGSDSTISVDGLDGSFDDILDQIETANLTPAQIQSPQKLDIRLTNAVHVVDTESNVPSSDIRPSNDFPTLEPRSLEASDLARTNLQLSSTRQGENPVSQDDGSSFDTMSTRAHSLSLAGIAPIFHLTQLNETERLPTSNLGEFAANSSSRISEIDAPSRIPPIDLITADDSLTHNGRAANVAAADLNATDLSATDLSATDLSATDLSTTDLSTTDLSTTDLSTTDVKTTDSSSTEQTRPEWITRETTVVNANTNTRAIGESFRQDAEQSSRDAGQSQTPQNTTSPELARNSIVEATSDTLSEASTPLATRQFPPNANDSGELTRGEPIDSTPSSRSGDTAERSPKHPVDNTNVLQNGPEIESAPPSFASAPPDDQTQTKSVQDSAPTNENTIDSDPTSSGESSNKGESQDGGSDQRTFTPLVDIDIPVMSTDTATEVDFLTPSQPADPASTSSPAIPTNVSPNVSPNIAQNIQSSMPVNSPNTSLPVHDVVSLTQQVATNISNIVESSESSTLRTVSLELHPAELGQLTIHVEQSAEAITAHIIASETVSMDLLENHKNLLLDSLNDLGVGSASVDISHEEKQGSERQEVALDEPEQSKTKERVDDANGRPRSVESKRLNIIA